MPLCDSCHNGLHGATGKFKWWTKRELREFQLHAIAATQAAWEGLDPLTRGELETCEEVF